MERTVEDNDDIKSTNDNDDDDDNKNSKIRALCFDQHELHRGANHFSK